MKVGQALLLLTLFFASCKNERIKEHASWQEVLKKYNVNDGGFIMKDNTHEIVYYQNKERVSEQMSPASTYKIFNSLIGLETNTIPDEDFVIPWDGKKRDIESWNQDLSMAQAFKYSALPYYQELARRVGREPAQKYLDTIQYGNMRIGPEVDMYWINDTLKISADEQVTFLKELYFKELPFSERAQRIVKKMMLQEEKEDYKLSYKTGTTYKGDNYLMWLVGWLEKVEEQKNVETGELETNYRPYFFALNYEVPQEGADFFEFLKQRVLITKDMFREMEIIK